MHLTTPHKTCTVTRPLVNHPQLEILTTPLVCSDTENDPSHVEYRVYHHQRTKDGKIHRGHGWGLNDLLIPSILIWAAWTFDVKVVLRVGVSWKRETVICIIWIILAIYHMYIKSNTVVYESITPLPDLGIQLSTTRGLSFPLPSKRYLVPLKSSHTFIPLSEISTTILNQALMGFSVGYYLGIVKRDGKGVVVAFNSIRPGFDVLREVYHGVRELMFNEYDCTTEQDNE